MKEKGVARRYATALISGVAGENELDKLGTDLFSFAKAYEDSKELSKLYMNPAIPAAVKGKVLSAIMERMKLSAKCRNFLSIIMKKGRVDFIHEIAEHFGQMSDEKLGRVKVEVLSAKSLSREEKDKLRDTFAAITGRDAKLQIKTDKSLIAGIVARIGSKVYDGSVKNQLKLMKVKIEGEAW